MAVQPGGPVDNPFLNMPKVGGEGGSGGEQQKNIIDALIVEPFGPKLLSHLSKFSGGMIINASNIEQGAPGKLMDAPGGGLVDGKPPSLAGLDSGQGGPIYRAIKMVFSNRATEDWAAGVGGGASIESVFKDFSFADLFTPAIQPLMVAGVSQEISGPAV